MNLDDFIITCFRVLDEMLPSATKGQRLRQRGPMPRLANSALDRWRKEYEQRGEAAFSEKEMTEQQALERKIDELERFCGQLAWENAVLKNALRQVGSRSDTP